MKSHAPSLYSLAVIHFNGSGGTRNDKDLRSGVALCAHLSATSTVYVSWVIVYKIIKNLLTSNPITLIKIL
jgi:hypothetical protein